MKRRKSENGQAIILLAIGIITLLGFTALAIDGGRTYSEKRTIQGVADTTSLTGALYLGKLGYSVSDATKAEAVAAALERAANNGYDSEHVTVTITEDPNFYYVETDIVSTVDPVFAQLVFGGDLTVAVESIARITKTTEFAMVQAFYAKNKSQCRAFDQGGNAWLRIKNSGIFSNSNTYCEQGDLYIGGNASMEGELLSAAGKIKVSGLAIVGGQQEGVPQQTLPTLPTPDCSDLTVQNDGTDLVPGIYNEIKILNNEVVTLAPGLYCIDGGLTMNGGTLTGDNVTLYFRGTADASFSGGDAYLTAPQGDVWADGNNMYWNGMLIYQAYGNTSQVVINGNTENSQYVGTIFAPDAYCKLNGTSEVTSQDIQVICDTIGITGTSDLDIDFNKTTKYVPPMAVDLVH